MGEVRHGNVPFVGGSEWPIQPEGSLQYFRTGCGSTKVPEAGSSV